MVSFNFTIYYNWNLKIFFYKPNFTVLNLKILNYSIENLTSTGN